MGNDEIRLIINLMFIVFIAILGIIVIKRIRINIEYNSDDSIPDIDDIDENARPDLDNNLKMGD